MDILQRTFCKLNPHIYLGVMTKKNFSPHDAYYVMPKLTNLPWNCYGRQWCMTPPAGLNKYCSHSCVIEFQCKWLLMMIVSKHPELISAFTLLKHNKGTVIKIIPVCTKMMRETLFRQHYSQQFIVRVLGSSWMSSLIRLNEVCLFTAS